MLDIPCCFYLADTDHPVDERSPVWSAPLPGRLNRDPGRTSNVGLTYGEYFTAVRSALNDADGALVSAALTAAGHEPVTPAGLSVFLIKHGAFYHPARVVVSGAGDPVVFGVTVAASEEGRERIASEARLLTRLRDRFDGPVVPAVFGFKQVPLASGMTVPLFVGEWFDGFDEFHLSAPDSMDNLPVLWRPDGPRGFSSEQTRRLYAAGTAVLTTAYDPMTSEHIQNWHHAAGDFVARPGRNDTVAVRLITARRYGPLLADGPTDPDEMMHALVVFFLSTLVGMRLDRSDGVGDPMWAGSSALTGAVDGFLTGLAVHEAANSLLDGIREAFCRVLTTASRADLIGLTEAAMERQVPVPSERLFIRRHINDHTRQWQAALRDRIAP